PAEEKRMRVLAVALTPTLFSAPLTAEGCNQVNEISSLKRFRQYSDFNVVEV
ncbi:MAG: hypothetical protein H6Q24_779, partial [Bacteroidetes bacterium]|nr:hypothetical protein [Bacteroidota bacterium]